MDLLPVTSLTFIVTFIRWTIVAQLWVWRVLFFAFLMLFLFIAFLAFGFAVSSVISWMIFDKRWVWQWWVWLLVLCNRWQLPVLCYHSTGIIYHYPFFGVIVLVILHDLIRQHYHNNQTDCYPFSLIKVNYPVFLINDHILYFQMYSQYLLFLQKYRNNISKIFKILQFLEWKFL